MWKKVLIIEDHDDFRQTVRGHLEQQGLGMEILEAGSGETGVPLALRERPDVVLMDIRLPGMSGIEAAERIKGYVPGCKIIALTMFETENFKKVFKTDHIHAYVGKSELYEKLVPEVLNVLKHEVREEASQA